MLMPSLKELKTANNSRGLIDLPEAERRFTQVLRNFSQLLFKTRHAMRLSVALELILAHFDGSG